MVLWQGLTEGGTAVPVQVTEAGRVVAEGQQGPEGPPGEQGPQGPQGEYGPGDDVDLGSITAAGYITSGSVITAVSNIQSENRIIADDSLRTGSVSTGNSASSGVNVDSVGNILLQRSNSGWFLQGYEGTSKNIEIASDGDVKIGGTLPSAPNIELKNDGSASFGGNETSVINSDGSASFASNKCGFTDAGEVFFTSRGTRYKLEVAGGLCNAIPYTREMQLRERAEALKGRIEDKRTPRTTDSVPED